MDKLVNTYNNKLNTKNANSYLELEIRYKKLNRTHVENLFKWLLSQKNEKELVEITNTVSTIIHNNSFGSNFKNNYIRESFMINKTKYSERYINKEQLSTPYSEFMGNENIYYVINLNMETLIGKRIMDKTAIIRLKSRLSHNILFEDHKWRIDMTIVKIITGDEALKKIDGGLEYLHIIKQKFFQDDLNADNFLKKYNEELVTQLGCVYEIELELINSSQVISKDILNAAKMLLNILDPNFALNNKYLQKIAEIKEYLFPNNRISNFTGTTLNKILPKAKLLTRYEYRSHYPLQDWYVTDKADGVRAIGVANQTGYILTDVLIEFPEPQESSNVITMVDAEYVNGVLWVFDIIVLKGSLITKATFPYRVIRIPDAVNELKNVGINAMAKPYIKLTANLEANIKEIYYRKDRKYNIDGLIFVKPDSEYMKTSIFKWKKTEDSTIDFYLKKLPEEFIGKNIYKARKGYDIYLLMVGISYHMYKSLGINFCYGYKNIFDDKDIDNNVKYFPIQFSPSNAPFAYIYYHPSDLNEDLSDNVVEFKCKGNCTGQGGYIDWEILKIRYDRQKDVKTGKYFGNDFSVAESNLLNFLDEFSLEDLWKLNEDDYFITTKSDAYSGQVGSISYAKNNLIMDFRYSKYILDIGSGKGQDLSRYFNAGIKNLIAFDNDKVALAELIRRKYTSKSFKNGWHNNGTLVRTVIGTMLDDYKTNVDKIMTLSENNLFDGIICNLAIHYFILTEKHIIDFANLANSILKKGGRIGITYPIGEKIFELLKDKKPGETWDVREGNILKYSIRKLYANEEFGIYNQKVEILLPFSNGKYYEENLVNTTNFINIMKKMGYTINSKDIRNINSYYLADFINSHKHINLTENDKEYIGLYGQLIFKKS